MNKKGFSQTHDIGNNRLNYVKTKKSSDKMLSTVRIEPRPLTNLQVQHSLLSSSGMCYLEIFKLLFMHHLIFGLVTDLKLVI